MLHPELYSAGRPTLPRSPVPGGGGEENKKAKQQKKKRGEKGKKKSPFQTFKLILTYHVVFFFYLAQPLHPAHPSDAPRIEAQCLNEIGRAHV